jgi:eukaryotic-like serine/threonine-protein kinase
MGVVHKAYDPVLDRTVAVKILHKDKSGKARSERLMREAKALARVNDPHVVVVYEVGTHAGTPFIAMEYAEGGTLSQWLAEKPRSQSEIVAAFVEAGRGLAAVHREGLVHRDFKPANVLIGRDGRFRVADFGIARASDDASLSLGTHLFEGKGELTREGSRIGTPDYMAPEQIRGEPANAASDQFAFCVALYEALCGARPTLALTHANNSVAATLVEPAENSALPAWTRGILSRGLSVARSSRFPSMVSLLRALVESPVKRARRRRAVIFGLALLVSVVPLWALAKRALRDAPCGNLGAPLAGVWDDATRGEVERAIRGSSRAHALATWERVRAMLDAYAKSWTVARVDACQATRVRGEQSEALLDLRMHCLERRRIELMRLREVLAKADDETVDNASIAVGKLTDVATCSDASALSARKRRSDPGMRTQEASLEDGIARAKASYAAGKYKDTLALIEPLVAEARAFDDSGLLAEALEQKGRAHYVLGQYEGAVATLRESALRADEAADDRIRFSATVHLIDITGYALEDEKQTDGLEGQARALVRRLGNDPAFVAELDEALTYSNRAFGRLDEARINGLENLALKKQMFRGDNLPYVNALCAMGRVAIRQGHVEEAIGMFEPALAMAERVLAPTHPQLMHYVHSLGDAYRIRGDLARALPLFRRDVALAEATGRSSAPSVGIALLGLSSVLLELGEANEALSAATRAREIFLEAFDHDNSRVGQAGRNVARALLDLHRLKEAERAALDVLAIARANNDKNKAAIGPAAADGFELLGEIATARGQNARALAFIDKAISALDGAQAADEPQRIDPLLAHANIELTMGHVDAALADTARAQMLLAKYPQAPDRIARALFIEAQARSSQAASTITTRDAARASAVAREALAKVDAMDSHVEPLRAELRSFLASH